MSKFKCVVNLPLLIASKFVNKQVGIVLSQIPSGLQPLPTPGHAPSQLITDACVHITSELFITNRVKSGIYGFSKDEAR